MELKRILRGVLRPLQDVFGYRLQEHLLCLVALELKVYLLVFLFVLRQKTVQETFVFFVLLQFLVHLLVEIARISWLFDGRQDFFEAQQVFLAVSPALQLIFVLDSVLTHLLGHHFPSFPVDWEVSHKFLVQLQVPEVCTVVVCHNNLLLLHHLFLSPFVFWCFGLRLLLSIARPLWLFNYILDHCFIRRQSISIPSQWNNLIELWIFILFINFVFGKVLGLCFCLVNWLPLIKLHAVLSFLDLSDARFVKYFAKSLLQNLLPCV